jgi:hypothetical protein
MNQLNEKLVLIMSIQYSICSGADKRIEQPVKPLGIDTLSCKHHVLHLINHKTNRNILNFTQ